MNEVAELELPTQENFRTDLQSLFRGAVRVALEVALEDELREMVGAKKWERQAQRVDSRNGTYLRRLITTMGAIDLDVPRAREGGSGGAAVIGRYRRRSAEIDDAMVSAYVHGASTRDIGHVTKALMGEHVSKSTVSRVAKTLGTKVEELRKAPIVGPIPYLFLDATFVDARWAREVENVSALVAYGIGLDGHRQLLAVTIGAEESEASWSDLLAQLNERGLSGVQFVIADAHGGLAKAVRHHLPEAPMQRCCVHLQRNVVGKAPQKLRARLARPSGRSSWRRPRRRPTGGWRSSPPVSDASSRRRWRASPRASRRPPASTLSPRSTGTASGPRTASSGSTARSSVGRGRSAPSRTARARSDSSPRSHSRSPRSGPTAATWTCPC